MAKSKPKSKGQKKSSDKPKTLNKLQTIQAILIIVDKLIDIINRLSG